MGEGRGDSELDEFEKLLGEIPNVTSGNPQSEDSQFYSYSKDFTPVGFSSTNAMADDQKVSSTIDILRSPIKIIHHEGQRLPNLQSLTTAFSASSFGDGCTSYSSLHSHIAALDEQHQWTLKKSPPQSPNSISDAPGNITHEHLNMFRFDVPNFVKQKVSYSIPVGNFSGTRAHSHEVQCFQFSPDTSVSPVEYSVITDQQQYLLEAHSQLPYLHPQQLSLPYITWSHAEEGCSRPQLQNPGMDAWYPYQGNGNVSGMFIGRNSVKQCNGVPLSSPHEQYKSHLFVSNGSSQSNPAFSSTDCHEPDILDRAARQMFPKKFLTWSPGLGSVRSAKFGYFGGNGLQINKRIKSLPHSNAGHKQVHGPMPQNLFHEITEVTKNPRLQPQKHNSMDGVCGKMYQMAKDPNGCRHLQRKFVDGSHEDVEKIFLEIRGYIAELMIDPFGNYLVQKLLDVCDEDQRMKILQAITWKAGELVNICCDIHGTRVIQKVIETLKTPKQFSVLVSSLKPGIVTLIKNMNGSHVVQSCLQYLMPEYRKFLFESASANCVELATDRYGCCVLQKCLGLSDGEQRCRLICEIIPNALDLSQDPFGNYVVQLVFELQIPWATRGILDRLQENYVGLSIQKYSSNVVEKCLKHAGEEKCSYIIQELMDYPHLDHIMRDPYGNYVIQAALNQSKGALHGALVEAIRSHIPVLRANPFGKKVLSTYSLLT